MRREIELGPKRRSEQVRGEMNAAELKKRVGEKWRVVD
jgi:hypothetical protein